MEDALSVYRYCSFPVFQEHINELFWHASDSTQVATTVVFEKGRKAIIGNIAFLLSVQ